MIFAFNLTNTHITYLTDQRKMRAPTRHWKHMTYLALIIKSNHSLNISMVIILTYRSEKDCIDIQILLYYKHTDNIL